MRIAIYTLGCKVNQYETQAMEQELTARGHELVDFEQPADAYIINTCSVTAVSDKLGIDLVGGTGQRMEFLRQLLTAAEKKTRVLVDDALHRHEFEILPAGGQMSRTRAMLKVEDGCRNFCTYCIIPFARGPVRSLPISEAVVQTGQLAAEGYQEVVITGIEISSWGQDLDGEKSLMDLLEAVSAAAGEMRLRLGSLEPRTITEDFCRRAAKLTNLCPHFHLSLQSGCDETLHRMNRRYDTERFYKSVTLLREFFPGVAITTDLITGFPGETEEEFQKTLDFIRRCEFAQIHVFPYSVRPGTRAAAMEQLPKSVKEEVAAQLHEQYLQSCVGQVYPVLFEQPGREGEFTGHAPNYMEVTAPGEDLHNCLRPVRITGVKGTILKGEIQP